MNTTPAPPGPRVYKRCANLLVALRKTQLPIAHVEPSSQRHVGRLPDHGHLSAERGVRTCARAFLVLLLRAQLDLSLNSSRLYGGGFYSGSASQYNATLLVERSIARGTPAIVIASNYRLGPLGFPQGKEAEEEGALNLGILDAKVALRWVHENIGAFGGDEKKVTVFGLSAGYIIANILMLDPEFSDLVRAAIMESGWAASSPLKLPAENEAAWRSFVSGISECGFALDDSTTFACLRSLKGTEAILANISPSEGAFGKELFPFGPVLDGPGGVIPDLPSRLYARGNFAKLPTISGTVLDEGTLFIPELDASFTTENIIDFLVANFTSSLVDPDDLLQRISELVSLYPEDPSAGSPFGTGNETFGLHPGFKRLAALVGDISFDSLRREWVQTSTAVGTPAYGFLFTEHANYQAGEAPPLFGGELTPLQFSPVVHGADNWYQFGTENIRSPADTVLATVIMDYWLSFATSLNPNDGLGSERPYWPAYDTKHKNLLRLEDDSIVAIRDDYRRDQLDFIARHPTIFHH
ncbi:Alpha/Beta hydrolase protein [Schizophyllum fasciatum]